jgi:hypothetical protein
MEWMLATNDCTSSSYSFVRLYLPHRWEILNFAFFPNMTLSNLNMFHPKKNITGDFWFKFNKCSQNMSNVIADVLDTQTL